MTRIGRRTFLGAAAGTLTAAMTGLTGARAVALEEEPTPPSASSSWDPWIEISAANLRWNLEQVRRRVGEKPVMAVIKANGYGHGLLESARLLQQAGLEHFLVAKLDEARSLRQAGIRGMILNFGPFDEAEAEEIVRLNLSQNVYDGRVQALARAAQRTGRSAHVHIKIDTGLGRVGVRHDRALDYLARVAALPEVVIDGIFMTFTEEDEADRLQLARLIEIAEQAVRAGLPVGLRSAASSAALFDYPEAYTRLDMVRPGIMLYGLYPSESTEREQRIELRPVLRLKTRVVQVKTLWPGESVGYHRAFVAEQPEPVATLPIGYFDGLPRALAGKGEVLIGGRRCPILTVSANAAIARLGPTPAAAGDEGVIVGTQGTQTITLSEIGRQIEASIYALAIGMSALLPRRIV